MIQKAILPTSEHNSDIVSKSFNNEDIVFGTTRGLVKKSNEDVIGYLQKNDSIKFCITDGHWGNKTSEMIVNYWLDKALKFPLTRNEAVKMTKNIEEKIFKTFGKQTMDENKDFTPEASFIAIELFQNKLKIVSYGDCRFLIIKEGKITLRIDTEETWLGAFSYLGLRKRLSVDKATKFQEIIINNKDVILLFTDGVDQCIYEKDTITFDSIAKLTTLSNPVQIFNSLIQQIFKNGAEDNASLAIIKNNYQD